MRPGLAPAVLTPPWARNPLWRRARRIPLLDLDFAGTAGFTDRVTGGSPITFTRASTATTVGPAGVVNTVASGAPRLWFNPATLACEGLLIEEQRANATFNSGVLTAASWTFTNLTVIASGTGPDNATAYEIAETTATGVRGMTNSGAATATASTSTTNGVTYTGSAWLKRVSVDWVQLTFPTSAFGALQYANFNLATGAIGATLGVTARIEQFLNGWFRCSIAAPATATVATATNHVIGLTNNANVASRLPSYTGNTANRVLVAMWQFEAGAFPTSYIPTTAAQVTRAADLALISAPPALRCLCVEHRGPASGTRGVVAIDDNSTNNRIELLTIGTDPRLLVVAGGVTVADLDAGAVTAGAMQRLAANIEANAFGVSADGGAEATDTSGALPTTDRIRLGSLQAGNHLCGTIARLAGWGVPLRVPDLTAP